LTAHAEREREADRITVSDLVEAFGSEALELLEECPDDPRGHSALFLRFTARGDPIHAVFSLADLAICSSSHHLSA